VHPGDTLKSLATRAYGSDQYWSVLRQNNPDKRELVIGDTWNV
jgi:hypothetical protein